MRILFLTLFSVVMAFSAQAHTQVAVIPLNSKAASLDNLVTVSSSGGDFTTIEAALSSISDASSANPYLIVVGPGTFTVTQPITMKSGVSIIGSGMQATVISGAVSQALVSSSAIFLAASDSVISSMTIKNTGGSSYSVGVYGNSTSNSIIEDVHIEASGAVSINYGIFDESGGLMIRYSTISVTDNSTSVDNTGLYCNDSTTTVYSVNITVEGAAASANRTGIWVTGTSDVTLDNLKIEATDGYDATGVWNTGANATFVLKDSEIIAGNGSNNNTAVYNAPSSGSAYLSSSLLQGTGNAVDTGAGSLTIASNSTLTGTISNTVCLNSNNGTSQLDTSCGVL